MKIEDVTINNKKILFDSKILTHNELLLSITPKTAIMFLDNCDSDLLEKLLLHCCTVGNLSIIKNILKTYPHRIDLNQRDKTGNTALMLSCYNGHLAIVQYLINDHLDDIDINARNKCHNSAFMLACSNGHLEIVTILLQHCGHNIEFNARDQFGSTALMSACSAGHLAIVKYLMEYDAHNSNRYHIDFWGYTTFIEQGPECLLNMRDNQGWTGLMSACSNNHYDIVYYLLEHYADALDLSISGIDDDNIYAKQPVSFFSYAKRRTALEIAQHRHHNDIAELLERHHKREAIISRLRP
jgi:ankyrin repeat protein